MNRASPVDMRKSMDAVDTFKRAGLLFVAMPVMDEADHAALFAESMRRLDLIANQCEAPSTTEGQGDE